jgi:hypothetical protein
VTTVVKSQELMLMRVQPLTELTMPNKFSTLLVSIVWSAGTSTRNNESWGLKGITVAIWLTRSE